MARELYRGKPRFKAGDRVTIKSWEKMMVEYGVGSEDRLDMIKVPFFFTPQQKIFCGKSFTIAEVGIGESMASGSMKSYPRYKLMAEGAYRPLERSFSEETFEESERFEKEKNMAKRLPQVGDLVTVKSWNLLLNENGGESDDGRINVTGPDWFTPEMKRFCGKSATVAEIQTEDLESPEESEYTLEGPDEIENYTFSLYMLKGYDENTEIVGSDSEEGKAADPTEELLAEIEELASSGIDSTHMNRASGGADKMTEKKPVARGLLANESQSLEDLTENLEQALTMRYQLSSGVRREGNEITVPPFMNLHDAAKAIVDFEKSSETEEESTLELEGHPWDCAYAFHRAMTEVYGSLTASHNYGWFGAKLPPKTALIQLSHKESMKIPIGNVTVPGLPISMSIEVKDPATWHPGENGATITFNAKRKYTPLIQEIEAATRRHLEGDSIFKGKAIDTSFRFIDITNFDRRRVIYSKDEKLQLQANIFTLIENTEFAKGANVPLKRGVLLHGDFGTGKTLTGLYTASLCAENGWTYILVRPSDEISAAIAMAKKLQPAVVFFEDIDAQAGEERTADVNELLNTIDGILSKDSQVMTVVTTNSIGKVAPGLLRPGRFDAVIRLGVLDQQAVMDFIVDCATDSRGNLMLDEKLDSAQIFEAARGYTPAFLKEAVSKASLYAISRGDYNGKSAHLKTADIVGALTELRPQYELMAGPREAKRETIGDMLGQMAIGAAEVVTGQKLDELMPNLRLLDRTNFTPNEGWLIGDPKELPRQMENAKKAPAKSHKTHKK